MSMLLSFLIACGGNTAETTGVVETTATVTEEGVEVVETTTTETTTTEEVTIENTTTTETTENTETTNDNE